MCSQITNLAISKLTLITNESFHSFKIKHLSDITLDPGVVKDAALQRKFWSDLKFMHNLFAFCKVYVIIVYFCVLKADKF